MSSDAMSDYSHDDEHDPQADELRETALVTLEALISSCTPQMQSYLPNTISSALRYLKYDPNVADNEDDEEMSGTQDDDSEDDATEEPDMDDDEFDDFEEEGGYSDIDDMSWKVRRCAAKLLYAVISTYGRGRALDEGSLYQQIAPAIISRFSKEREESVKLELVSTMNALVRKTGEGSMIITSNGFLESVGSGSKISRKRRRQDSDASMIDFEPTIGTSSAAGTPLAAPASPKSGAQAELANALPVIVRSLVKMWKQASIPLKQAIIVLLKSLALVRYGGLADHLQQIEDPIADVLKSSLSGGSSASVGSSASAGTLQIETLGLISAISETHTSDALLPFLIALIPGVISAVNDRNYKVSSEALAAVEQIVKALTPPRVTAASPDLVSQLEKLYDVSHNRIADTSSDLEVRQRAIHVLGVLLARTSCGEQGVTFLSLQYRSKGLATLLDRLKNETTRLSAVRAIDDVAILCSQQDDVDSAWVREVTTELGAQLRKSDRVLRSASLETLRSLSMNPTTRAHYDGKTMRSLEGFLIPLISVDDFHLLAPSLIIIAKLVPGNAHLLVNDDLVAAVCSIVKTFLAGTVLKSLLLLVKVIGEEGSGSVLMQKLLRDVGVEGDTSVVGRAIGTLLVHGGSNVGVRMEDFLSELQKTQDVQRQCLALAILGETALRLGANCSLAPDVFITHFNSKSEKVRLAAAAALGNAAAGNVNAYLPTILGGLKSESQSYLLLHSVKELLQHPELIRQDVAPSATKLWQALLVVSKEEDNRAVGAECVGRLALLDLPAYIPQFQEYLSNGDSSIRSIVISAFRFTLSDPRDTYNDVLRPLVLPLLVNMLSDRDLGNHRLALTTLNSAIHNKLSLILPHLGELLPAVLGDTQIKPELIREVQMGPFKHKVDDGLELRKSAYETLYAALDTSFTHSHLNELFSRILAGIDDEQDIRTISNLMTSKLITLAPEETNRHLDALSERYTSVLSFKPKENAVKQELEKAQEASTGILKITRELSKAFPGAEAAGDKLKWKGYMEWVRTQFGGQFGSLENEF
ncbi:armadillo-type protein [Aspergillus filifer]